jgi:hypothetical protein
MLKVRHIILVLALALLAAMLGNSWGQSQQPPSEPQRGEQPTPSDQRGTEQSPIIVKVLPTPKTETETAQDAKDREEKFHTDQWLVRWTGAVALFTLALVVIGSWQGRQLKKSVDVLTQAERAQMFVIIRGESIHDSLSSSRKYGDIMGSNADTEHIEGSAVHCVFKNYGKTPAIIKEISLRLSFFEKLPPEPEYFPRDQILKEYMIGAGDETDEHPCIMDSRLTVRQGSSVVRAQSYIWFYGRIVYFDTFGQRHEHRFLWRYGGAHGFRPNFEHPKYIKNT